MKQHSRLLEDFYSWSDEKISFVIYIITQIYFIVFLFRDIPPGDATEGLYQITQFDLSNRAPFVAYHAIGIMFTQGLSWIGVPPILALNFMSSFFGAIGAAFTYKFAKHFLGDTKIALLATALTVFSGVYWLFAEIGDTYIVHTAFLLISFVMFLEKRFVLSGIAYGIALLVYPQVGLVAPFYPVVAYYYRYGFKNFLKTVVSAVVIYLPPVIILFQEYLWGRMGLYNSLMFNSLRMKSPHNYLHYLKGTYYIAKSLHIALPLMAIGFYKYFLRNRPFAVLILLLVPTHLYMNIIITQDLDSYSLSIYPFLGILSAVGLMTVVRFSMFQQHYSKILSTVVLIYIILSFVLMVGPVKWNVHDLREFAESFHSNQIKDYRLISDWGTCINYNFYTSSTLYTGKCISYENITDNTINNLYLQNIPLYFYDPGEVMNPLKVAIKRMVPDRYVSRVKKTTRLKEFLEVAPHYKLKLIKATPFNVYEIYM